MAFRIEKGAGNGRFFPTGHRPLWKWTGLSDEIRRVPRGREKNSMVLRFHGSDIRVSLEEEQVCPYDFINADLVSESRISTLEILRFSPLWFLQALFTIHPG